MGHDFHSVTLIVYLIKSAAPAEHWLQTELHSN